jgi:hypothetical protein
MTTEEANKIIEQVKEGDLNPLEVYVKHIKQKKLHESISKEVYKLAIEEAEKYDQKTFREYDSEINISGTGKKYNFEEDLEYFTLKSQLKEREELLKKAVLIKEDIVGEDGEVVPKVSLKSAGGTKLTIK